MGVVVTAFSRFWKRLVFGSHPRRPEYEDLLAPSTEILQCVTSEGPDVRRRQDDDDDGDDDDESDGTSTVTVTVTTTAVEETTVTDSTTTTDVVTSTITKTIFQTSTRSARPPPIHITHQIFRY